MVYRKGELQSSGIDRGWPYQVALPASASHGQNYNIVHGFCRDEGLSLCPRGHGVGDIPTYHNVYCFAEEAHARRFLERFGGFRIEPTARARNKEAERLRAEWLRSP
jgi:hypothetical protein